MAKISKILAREILDSRGNPTVEVDVHLSDSSQGRAAVPSGASTGAHEALELRDGVKNRYLGKGVQKSVQNIVEKIQPLLIGKEASQQTELDQLMIKADGTSEKKNFGANSILGVSLALAKAQAASEKTPFFKYAAGLFGNKNPHLLPVPLMNVINGGAHADNGLDIQEFMIVPAFGMKFSEALRAGAEIFHNLKSILKSKNLVTAVGDEGGFAPSLKSNIEALELLCGAIEKSGYKLGEQISLGLDVAATELYEGGSYRWEGKALKSSELTKIYNSWSKNFPLVTIEDGLAEDDWAGWTGMTQEIGKSVQIVGDDLFVTNPQRLKMGIEKKAANALLVKVNQIGSLTETFEAIKVAHGAGFRTILSHRSGETEDSIIADLAVATGSQQIKTGSLCRGERTAKYNQLLRIEEFLGDNAGYWGRKAFI